MLVSSLLIPRVKELRLKAESVTRGQVSPGSRRARESVELGRELACAGKTLTLVRRAALQEMLELELQQHSEALSRAGKAFYNQRRSKKIVVSSCLSLSSTCLENPKSQAACLDCIQIV
ncbi:uncharacterized protein C1orf189-like [Polyodon spathula]|uniref:uncharacterized protein C1orf189-like n=1 Tax=Polyodon spathula TaxID=7913 RepID=UPI001B7F10E0|nr:uncharacterized protein C1orf189-like [Polyodon spathula]